MTVLFADVVHSMDIAAAVGAERLREIMTELVNRATSVVHRYGGTVDKFTGDGIMAVFGAPVALEDHTVRACLAALEIQAQTAQLAKEVEARGVDVPARKMVDEGHRHAFDCVVSVAVHEFDLDGPGVVAIQWPIVDLTGQGQRNRKHAGKHALHPRPVGGRSHGSDAKTEVFLEMVGLRIQEVRSGEKSSWR